MGFQEFQLLPQAVWVIGVAAIVSRDEAVVALEDMFQSSIERDRNSLIGWQANKVDRFAIQHWLQLEGRLAAIVDHIDVDVDVLYGDGGQRAPQRFAGVPGGYQSSDICYIMFSHVTGISGCKLASRRGSVRLNCITAVYSSGDTSLQNSSMTGFPELPDDFTPDWLAEVLKLDATEIFNINVKPSEAESGLVSLVVILEVTLAPGVDGPTRQVGILASNCEGARQEASE